jgi:signal transduction histidine kinase
MLRNILPYQGTRMTRTAPTISPALLIIGLILINTCAHFLTPESQRELHQIYRRLYYLPIILASLYYGMRGGLFISILISCFYVPHAFFMKNMDPSPQTEKIAEIILYNAIAFIVSAITDRLKNTMMQLRQEEKEKNEAEKKLLIAERHSLLGKFITGLVHDLRQPFNSIKIGIEMLAEKRDSDPNDKTIIELALREIKRIEKDLQGILDYARPRTPEKTVFPLAEFIQHLVTNFETTAAKQQTTLVLNIGHDAIIEADMHHLEQICLNLLLNALQARQSGGIITISLDRDEQRNITLAIADEGSGIKKGHLALIFEPYFSTKKHGVGLGLAIVKNLVEINGGSIAVTSQENMGTTFSLHFRGQ